YRDAAAPTLVLRPDGGRMFLSAEPVGDRFAREARRHLTYAVLALAAQMVGQLWALDPYRALRSEGVVWTLPAETRGTRSTGGRRPRRVHVVRVSVGARERDIEVSAEGYERVRREGTIPCLVARGPSVYVQAGERARVSEPLAGCLALVVMGLVGAHAAGRWSRRAWHERRWFIEHEPGPMMYAVTRPPKG
ncbi:MAG: hypothetical protein R3A52_29545, partial [Polyangiales bacterium]